MQDYLEIKNNDNTDYGMKDQMVHRKYKKLI